MSADASGLRDALTTWAYETQRGAVDDVPDLVRPSAPVSTPTETSTRAPGQLRDSITVGEPVGAGGPSFRGRVVAPVPQAVWTDRGTERHDIPSGGAAAQHAKGYPLRFYWARTGGVVFRWSVDHPGNAAMNWWEPAVRRAYAQALLARALATPFGG